MKRHVARNMFWALSGLFLLPTLFYVFFALVCEDDWCFGWGWWAIPYGVLAGLFAALALRLDRRSGRGPFYLRA